MKYWKKTFHGFSVKQEFVEKNQIYRLQNYSKPKGMEKTSK